jgi:hypothetical protein
VDRHPVVLGHRRGGGAGGKLVGRHRAPLSISIW